MWQKLDDDGGNPSDGWCVRGRRELSKPVLVLCFIFALPLAVFFIVGTLVASFFRVSGALAIVLLPANCMYH